MNYLDSIKWRGFHVMICPLITLNSLFFRQNNEIRNFTKQKENLLLFTSGGLFDFIIIFI